MKDTIVLLAADKASSHIVYHGLKKHFQIQRVILEERIAFGKLLKRRIRKLGITVVLGQIAFRLFIVPLLQRVSTMRKKEIFKQFDLADHAIEESQIIRVPSVNDEKTIKALQDLDPAIVVINGTRIISQKVIDCIPGRFLNMHAGITPLYRGVHGAYWSLAGHDRDHCGVTVHLVDKGIDTGGILDQVVIQPAREDNFVTYPLLQIASGIPCLTRVVQTMLQGIVEEVAAPEGESRLWSHPTLVGYFWRYVRHRIK